MSSTQASLSWSASVDNVLVTQYKVYRNGVAIGTSAGTTFTDSGLSASTTYSYAVSARDAAGNESGVSGSASVTTPATPFSVVSTQVTAKAIGEATIAVTTSHPASVSVKYGTSASALTSSAESVALATSHSLTVTGLERRTKYFYQVVATNESGATALSAVFNFRTR